MTVDVGHWSRPSPVSYIKPGPRVPFPSTQQMHRLLAIAFVATVALAAEEVGFLLKYRNKSLSILRLFKTHK